MNILIKILKGMSVGIGSILPGVSGSMIATTFNFYEDLIEALNNFIKEPIKSIVSIWEYVVGIILGLGLGVVLISKILALYPFTISFFFIGLILGTIPTIIREEKENKKKWYHYVISLVAIGVGLLLLFIKPANVNELSGFKEYLVYVVVGVFVAVPLIIPGISGATILLMLGFYKHFTDVVTLFLKSLINLDFKVMLNTSLPILVIGVSAFVGLILFGKLMSYILKNHKSGFNFAVLGLLIISPVNVIWSMYLEDSTLFDKINVLEIIVGVLLFIGGLALTYYTSKLELKNEENLEN